MDRREALKSVGVIFGGTIVGSQAFLIACAEKETKSELGLLSDQQIDLLNELGEVILPKTHNTPGAKEVNVGSFMNSIVSDFYTEEEQDIFVRGIDSFKALSDDEGGAFATLVDEKKQAIVEKLEKEASLSLNSDESHYYIMMKQLTIWGYLSSEEVAFNGFNHMVMTSDFESCIDVNEQTKGLFREASSGQAYNYATHHMKNG